MAATAAAKNRKIRQEALREQLAAQGHVQHVIDIANKLSNLDIELEYDKVQRLKAAADIKQKLISKYLPDLKATELTAEGGEPLFEKITDADIAKRITQLIAETGITSSS